MAVPWLTSDALIAAIKRKISFPVSQNTFSETELLAFANEEMMISQVPSMLEYHEEYFVFIETVELEDNKTHYPFPNRAIGMRLRDVFYEDAQGNLFEMTRINPDEKAMYQQGASPSNMLAAYYLQGNEVVLTPNNIFNPTGSLQFVYFIRPNQLVLNERAATIENFRKVLEVTNASLVAGDTVTLEDVIFTAVAGSPADDTEFQIAGSSALTAINLAAAINASIPDEVTATTSSGNVLLTTWNRNFSYESSNEDALFVTDTIGLVLDSIPDNIAEGTEIDILQTKPGHRTYAIDIYIDSGDISGDVLTLDEDDVPDAVLVGDYICTANECIIPQIPPELHNGLAERACARILAAIGDQQGLQVVNDKLQEIDRRQGNLIDQRVDGAPQKVTNRYSLLRTAKRHFNRIF